MQYCKKKNRCYTCLKSDHFVIIFRLCDYIPRKYKLIKKLYWHFTQTCTELHGRNSLKKMKVVMWNAFSKVIIKVLISLDTREVFWILAITFASECDASKQNFRSKVGLCSKRPENNTGCWSSWKLHLFLAQPTIILQFSAHSQHESQCERPTRDTHKMSFKSAFTHQFPISVTFTTMLSKLRHFWFPLSHIVPIKLITMYY